ncbi:MAG: zinc ribbon domain-containing protein [Phycisphaerales bacterium]|nr:zinc ribbon domain-containing protein [Phycisphaerales bacterium]
MPTYEYRCNKCHHYFENFHSMKDKPKRICPACGKPALERLIGTGAAIIFKGSGFYQTDYRSESYKKSAEADKPSDKSATSDKASSSDKAADSGSAAATKPVEKSSDKSGDSSSSNKPESGPAPKPDKRPDSKPDKKPERSKKGKARDD